MSKDSPKKDKKLLNAKNLIKAKNKTLKQSVEVEPNPELVIEKGVTALQKEIINLNVLKLFMDHFNQIRDFYTADAFIFFITPQKNPANISGRLFYNVSGPKHETIGITFPSIPAALEREIQVFAMQKKFQPYFNQFSIIFEQLIANQESFKEFLEEYKKNNPGKSEEMKAFLIAQTGYTLVETVLNKRYENHPDTIAFKKIEREIDAVRSEIKKYEALPKENQDPKKLKGLLKEKEKKYIEYNKKRDPHSAIAQTTRDALAAARLEATAYAAEYLKKEKSEVVPPEPKNTKRIS